MIDLRPRDRRIIEQLATEIFPAGTQLLAYGSRVKGTAHPASDLDLVVKAAPGQQLNLEQLSDFVAGLQDSTIPIMVQVFGWDEVPEAFKEAIEKEHEVMLEVGHGG